jgi:hypothetical protein
MAATVAAVVDAGPPSVRANAWVAAHRGNLPETLDALSGYPVAYRKAVFLALPSAKKAELWRAQLQAFSQTPGITAEQRAFIDRNIEALTPTAYNQHPKTGPLADLCKKIAALFPVEQRSAFSVLGPPDPVFTVSGLFVNLSERFRQSYVVRAADRALGRQVGDCSCSAESGCSCITCWPPPQGCNTSNWGCGCEWLYQCDGLCGVKSN